MKRRAKRANNQSGSVLVMCLCVAAVLAITLGGYLAWMRSQNALTFQSQAWNNALTIAEAGVEEALAQVNIGAGTNYGPSIATNWPVGGGVYGPKVGRLQNGFYSAIIIPQSPGPTIISTGYTRVPYMDIPIARTVRATTRGAALFDYAMAAQDNISFKGNNIAVDSFDSGDPNHSTPDGKYDRAKRKAGGDVASNYGVIEVGNANVNGKVRIGPGQNSSFSFGPNGFAGDLNWTGPGAQPGWAINDFNMDFPDVMPPSTASWLPPLGPIGTNKYVLGSGGFVIGGDLVLNSGETMLVAGNADLFVKGDVDMKGGGTTGASIEIAPGASLRIYVAGASSKFSQVNTSGNASSFQYYGLPTNTSLSWSGNDAYTGTIYAPSAVFTLSGSGDPKNPSDYQGACVVGSVVMNGHFNFHYDEALARMGPFAMFKVVSWAEL